jgi:hypothetical protein
MPHQKTPLVSRNAELTADEPTTAERMKQLTCKLKDGW